MKKLLLLVSVVLLGGAAAWAQAITETDDRYAKETPPTGIEQEYEFKFTPVDVSGANVDVKFYILPAQADVYSVAADGTFTTTGMLPSGVDEEHSITLEPSPSTKSSDGFTVDASTNVWSKSYTNVTAQTTASIKLTWNPKSVVTETNKYIIVAVATECTNNLAVWEVDPSNNFMINVENLTASVATSTDPNDFIHCPSAVQGVTYDATNGLTYDYGEDVVYVRLEAKNYGSAWTPNAYYDKTATPKLNPQDSPVQSVTTGITPTIEYITYTVAEENALILTGNPPATTAWTAASTDDEIPSTAKPIVYLKYTFDNTDPLATTPYSYQGLTDNTITITATGVDAANNNDVAGDWEGKTGDASDDVTADTEVTQKIKARPTVAAN